MTPDRAVALFFELFSGLPRQGPGNTASTRRPSGSRRTSGRAGEDVQHRVA